jgi:ribonuclease III
VEDIEQFLKKNVTASYKDLKVFDEAFTHRSFSRVHNERLEFLGDAVLELVVTELLFADYKEMMEGQLTSFRAAIVKTESLAHEADRLGMNDLIRMSKGEEATGGRYRQYILADVFEAFIGALYLDQGYDIAKEFIITNLYYKMPGVVASRSDIDAKSRLQEYSQERFKETPYYRVIKEDGPDHDKTFTVAVMISDKEYKSGSGKSKQLAEQDAAAKTLTQILSEEEKPEE